MKTSAGSRQRLAKSLKPLQQIRPHAAGIDIGAQEIFVCVPDGCDEHSVRQFGTFTRDLSAIARWLTACGIETVAMESTGIYWIPLYEVLEEAGFEVYLVNARQVKNVSGRKSDVLDCQWLMQLHTYGLLQGSFRPPADICALRSLVRHREGLIRYRAVHVQHMQKALGLMNVKLTTVVSDITGLTGMAIIRAILRGERDPNLLSQYRNGHCRHSAEDIALSLSGHYQTEHLFALQQAVELYDTYTHLIERCDVEMAQRYQAMDARVDLTSTPVPGVHKPQRGNAPAFDVRTELYRMSGVDLTQIDGVSAVTAQAVISEVGVDMSKWRTEKHFASWLGVCPDNRISGGKVLSTHTKKTQNRANKALRLAAQSLYRSQSALGTYFRRMRAKLGAPAAITATAHKLARIIYRMLKYGQQYVAPSPEQYDQKQRSQLLKRLKQRAGELGYTLVTAEPTPSTQPFVS